MLTRAFITIIINTAVLGSLVGEVSSFSIETNSGNRPTTTTTPVEASRRGFLRAALAIATTSTTTGALLTMPTSALAVEGDVGEDIEVYFGCGCFWHVQHEFVEAERRLLNRSDDFEITARAGYAGGKAGAKNGKVCYHNAAQVSDYGSLGHAEVVQVKIPKNKFPDFVTEYCKLFNEQGYRPDQFQDRGAEYRNLVGLPGGVDGPYSKMLVEASAKAGDKLDFAKGKGDDPDRRALVFVMDTTEFPFYVAEQYHQFHDGFNFGENYPNSYNNLAEKLAKEGILGKSDCPNGLIGIGALGL